MSEKAATYGNVIYPVFPKRGTHTPPPQYEAEPAQTPQATAGIPTVRILEPLQKPNENA